MSRLDAGPGARKLERGSFAGRQRAMRLMLNLATQGALLLVVLVAGALVRDDARWLYLWASVVPVGFSLVYVAAYRRGERVRAAGEWTPAWEKGETRRSYAWLALVGLLFVAGAAALVAL